MKLSEEAKKIRTEYQRPYIQAWRQRNKEHIREYNRQWRQRNREKCREYQAAFWERKADEQMRQLRENISGGEL